MLLLAACNNTKTYSLAVKDTLPDSNKVRVNELATKIISGTNFHLTAGDYEDPEDVINEAFSEARALYSVKVPCLCVVEGGYYHYLLYEECSPYQKQIFDSLVNYKLTEINK